MLSFLVAGIQKLFFLPTHPEYRPVSTFFNANHYATIVEFVVLIALYRLSHRTGHRKFYIGIIAINLAGLYLTGSMSSLAALSCAALVFLILKGKNKLALGLVGADVYKRQEFTDTLPPYQIACGASDILSHLMERYFTQVEHVDSVSYTHLFAADGRGRL